VSALLALKQRLAEITRPAVPSDGVPTGIAALDRMLGGGLPRGRLTEVAGARGSGKTTIVRQVVATVVGAGGSVAYIDAGRTLAASDWVDVAAASDRAGGGFWVIRPPDPGRGAWSADVALRSGGFGLVVLDGVPTLTRAVTARLTQLAREGDAAVLAVGEDDAGWRASLLGVALRLRVGAGRRGAVVVSVEKGGGGMSGSSQSVEVRCGIRVARRLCADPEVPDRRGVARRARGAGGTLPPSRRMGTPDYPVAREHT